MKTSNIANHIPGYEPIAQKEDIQYGWIGIHGFRSTLKTLFFLLVLLNSKTVPAQDFTYLNKYYFPISDTTKYKPQYYQQSIEKEDSLIISIYTLDHHISKRKVISFDKEKLDSYFAEFRNDAAENVKRLKDLQFAKHSEYTFEYHPNGNIKSKDLYINGVNMVLEYFDEEGNPEPSPYDRSAIPDGGIASWYRYLMTSLQFPTDARQTRQTGKVHVYFELDEFGKIQNPEIMNPEEISPILGNEVIRVIKAYPHKWKPALKDGQPTKFSVMLPVGFEMK